MYIAVGLHFTVHMISGECCYLRPVCSRHVTNYNNITGFSAIIIVLMANACQWANLKPVSQTGKTVFRNCVCMQNPNMGIEGGCMMYP
jgi:hypothetical protein